MIIYSLLKTMDKINFHFPNIQLIIVYVLTALALGFGFNVYIITALLIYLIIEFKYTYDNIKNMYDYINILTKY